MIKSYFFIPAHSNKFIEKIEILDADYYILDVEDSVPIEKKDIALNNILNLNNKSHYIRPFISDNQDKSIKLLSRLFDAGYNNIILPKSENLMKIFDCFPNKKFILLVESASIYVDLKEIIHKYKYQIQAIALGSQDLSNDLRIKNDNNLLNIIRLNLTSIAKFFGIEFIDTASMNIEENSANFKKECINAYNLGCQGKFIIHPNQLKCLREADYFSDNEVKWAKKILKKIDLENTKIGAVKINQEVIEKPHLNKLLEIKRYIDERKL